MTSDYIPFLNSRGDCEIFKKHFANAAICRVTLDRSDLALSVAKPEHLWIDIGFDGFSQKQPLLSDKWSAYVKQFGDTSFLGDDAFLAKPSESALRPLVVKMLNEAAAKRPAYLSIPQFPHSDGVKNNKLNRMLCDIARDWRVRASANIKFILPILFTNQSQLVGKTERLPKVKLAASLIERSGADGYWSVDCSLDDQRGAGNFEKERFPAIVSFFSELNRLRQPAIRIVGPYWGLNLVLWAQGLASHFAIGLGGSYNHHLSGGRGWKPKTRVAISCLRRWVIANNELEVWLDQAAAKLPVGSPERAELEKLKLAIGRLQVGDAGKRQIAESYSAWIAALESITPPGRALALYQQLSTAFVIGRNLPELPKGEGTARRPERVAQQLMLNCL